MKASTTTEAAAKTTAAVSPPVKEASAGEPDTPTEALVGEVRRKNTPTESEASAKSASTGMKKDEL